MKRTFFSNLRDSYDPPTLLLSVGDDDGDDGAGAGGDGGAGDDPPTERKAPDVLTLDRKTFNERLERAKRSGQSELLTLFGVKTADELKAMAEAIKGKLNDPAKDDAPKGKDGADTAEAEKRWKADRKALEDQLKRAEQAREEAVEAERTQARLERACDRAGIQDTEYALTLLRRHVSGLSEKQAEKFDAGEWLKNLATERPYLCEASERKANTGTGGNGADNDPTPERGAGRNGAPPPPAKKEGGKGFSAMTASKDEVKRRLDTMRNRR